VLLIPYAHFHERMQLPIATVLLIVLNVVIFGVQIKTDWRHSAAVEAYAGSGLASLEFPVLSQLEPSAYPKDVSGAPALPAPTDLAAYRRVIRGMLTSEAFQIRLRSDTVFSQADQRYAPWKAERKQFDRLLRGIQVLHYGFVPAEHRWTTSVTSAFLHGSLGHLIGNMVMLAIIGIALEGVIGTPLTAGLYVATAFFSSLADYYSRPDSYVVSIGASGALYGFMGAFTVIYGFRHVRVILFFIFPILYRRFNLYAVFLLPYWFGLEALNYAYLRDSSNVNFAAHLGGLVSGAVIGLVMRPFREKPLDALDSVD
jgi:membrane associated rhomboid family serine protease